MLNDEIQFGDRRLVGQQQARQQISKILKSGRIGHSYLFTGPKGTGKTAFALAMAEIINGVENITDLKGTAASRKSSWYSHPDIHLFIPLPTSVTSSELKKADELKNRLQMLQKDPYEIIDFTLRPVLDDDSSSKNLRAFYPIDYFRDDIRPKVFLKPNEGKYTIVILTEIELMKKEAANYFLKLLEEPPANIIFLLTANNPDQLLPTIISRCQQIRLNPLSLDEISGGLIDYDGFSNEEASFMARISGGNYALTRFFDLDTLQQTRDEVISFLRLSYAQDAQPLLKLVQDWQSSLNLENQIALCNTLETLLRDIMVYSESKNEALIINSDKLDVISKFSESLPDADIPAMITHLQHMKILLYQNVQFKLIFTALALRYFYLMRGQQPVIKPEESWKHLPALAEY